MAYALTYLEQLNRESTHRGNSRIFFDGVARRGSSSSQGGAHGKSYVPQHKLYVCVYV